MIFAQRMSRVLPPIEGPRPSLQNIRKIFSSNALESPPRQAPYALDAHTGRLSRARYWIAYAA